MCGIWSTLIIVGLSLFLLWVVSSILFTFINNFFRYGHVELIHEKFDSLEAFKAFNIKVELQKGKKITVVNSNNNG